MAFVVILQSNKLLCVPHVWVQTQIVGEKSVIYYSKKFTDTPNFDLKKEHFFSPNAPACYNALVCKRFGKYLIGNYIDDNFIGLSCICPPTDSIDEGEAFLDKRPRRFRYNNNISSVRVFEKPKRVMTIEISDDDEPAANNSNRASSSDQQVSYK